ncbi:MAG: AAA family ATPase [Acidobacteriota bacterium]
MGKIKEEQKPDIIAHLKNDQETFLKALERPFGNKTAHTILDMVKAEKWEEYQKDIHILHRALFRRAITHRPFFQLKQWIIYYSGRLKTYLFPSHGLFAVFIGPDGSGKTTTAKALLESDFINKLFRRKEYFYRRFYVSWLKRMAYLIKRENLIQLDARIDKDEKIIPLNALKATIYVLYLGLEFFLGHYTIRKEKANAAIVIFDRYYYDYLLFEDFVKCPRWVLFFIAKVIPRPDAIIYLKNTPEVIHSRKQEKSIEEIRRQSEICEEIVRRLPNTFIIDTSLSPEGVEEKIQKIIIDNLKERKARKKLIEMINKWALSERE